ncbi:MAG: FG-GAP repeat protein [Parcubacteria group bacterium GW2011_GWE2_39_37]|uniref:FG-GAP repeat protein n=1 Tax=Candidatus Falkowbacteria bacterium GW2011_GWF2_39_8 TaxID=1618642 RepID=A0A0G0SFH3_9BACT|nr:MAG: FG-GAP repeat protein [Parcubacteria group bacterium GW2011_GWE2_39_37]KKR33460.1 MAG: FG-GAP repeat protein [Candidatus Falkowbacteria bacterium GW2011_GWF2_39_8]
MQKIKTLAVLLSLSLMLTPQVVFADKDDYPKLANYYLKYFDQSDYEELYKWNLIITPAEMAYYNKPFFEQYHKKNKNGILLAYVYPAMINEYDINEQTGLHHHLYTGVENNDWWLRNERGEKLEIWPNLYAVNVTKKSWQDYNVKYVKGEMDKNVWDGIMYDTVDSSITHYSKSGGIDVDGDGSKDDPGLVNQLWQEGMAELFKKTRLSLGDKKIILINGNSLDIYQPYINGRMFETFPTPWEGNGSWSSSMNQYLIRLPAKNRPNNIYVINGNTNNTGAQYDFKKLRYGLSSTLQGDGYFSFDFGDKSHAQTWWYDEYDINLGQAESPSYNLLNKDNKIIKPGLWRRDYEMGTAIVNSTSQDQLYIFSKEEFEKIKGIQDKKINDGSKINWIKLAPNDGILLLKPYNQIKDTSFINGGFVRVFNGNGEKTRNGFFAYKDNFPGNTKILITDLYDNGDEEILTNGKGQISIWNKGKKKISFFPYGSNFKHDTNFALGDIDGDGSKEIITSVGTGGGPQIKIFNNFGKQLTPGFFAYDKNFRGGASIALGDLNGDGIKEIVAAPGKGGGPQIRVFNKDGKVLNSFFAYDKGYRGGITVAVGDLNGDGRNEIITAPGSGRGPQIKIFNSTGKLLGSFFAYDKTSQEGISVNAADINLDGKAEILVNSFLF